MYLHSAMRNSFGAPPLAEQLYTIVAMTSKLRTMQIFRSSAMRPKLHGERERERPRTRKRERMHESTRSAHAHTHRQQTHIKSQKYLLWRRWR